MKRFSLTALALVFSLCTFAAEPPKQQLFVLYQETVNPSMVTQYEGATRDLVGAFAEKKAASPSFSMTAFMTTDMRYMYLTPISGYAQIDAIHKEWMNGGDVIGKDRFADIMKRSAATMTSYDEAVVMRRGDLSYEPENPRFKMADEPFARLDYYFLRPGTEAQAEQVARDYVALFREKKIPDGFTIYMAVTGHDLPLLVAVIPAKSPADFAATDEKTAAALGDALRVLQGRALAITRRIEHQDTWIRPDLSYLPGAAK